MIKLQTLRNQIDVVDRSIISLLRKRNKISIEVAVLKNEEGLPLFDEARWKVVLGTRLVFARENGVDTKLVKSLYKQIHKDSLRIQQEVIDQKIKLRN